MLTALVVLLLAIGLVDTPACRRTITRRVGFLRIPTMSPPSTAMALAQLDRAMIVFGASNDGLIVDVMRNTFNEMRGRSAPVSLKATGSCSSCPWPLRTRSRS
jgi:hypothetical protein